VAPGMKPRIFVNGRFLAQPLSGVQRFATEITTGLLQLAGSRVTVLAPPGAEQAAIPAQIIGKRSGQAWEQFELPSHAMDGVLINLGNTGPLRQRRQVVIIHDAAVHATPEGYDWKFRLWYKFMQGRLLARGALAVTVSEFSRRELSKWLGVAADEIGVISEGADHMLAIDAEPAILRTLPPGRFVLAVGNLAAHKNLRALSELALHLRERDVSLVITGGLAAGAFRPNATNALPQPACYVGRVSDGALKALYQAASCLVFPSIYEGFGLPAVEAMACGCPVAASDIPALREVCGDAALFFDSLAPRDIAQQVCRIVDDASLLEQLRTAGSAHVRNMTWARAAAQLAEIVDAYYGRVPAGK
jgi:glycosyltransferase involved in cell wall biosynthesis